MTYRQAIDQLPQNAAWSCSFGYPGEEQHSEYWRANGRRYLVEKHYDVWSIRED